MKGEFVAVKFVPVQTSSSETVSNEWQQFDRWEYRGYLKSFLRAIINENSGSGNKVVISTSSGDFLKEFIF
ncbi:hypothetical protein [Paenibacillus wenxiniae]|uniref:Uncharacterized protein n=1 Tax=Paenibacillus wenxiniae TaxID=1636843 RepID=A0ABW4RE40_9BACL